MTIAYEPEGDGATDSDCTPATTNNEVAPLTRTNTTDISFNSSGDDSDVIELAWTTPSGEPNVADWPSGDYRGSVECQAIGAEQSFKIQLLRINSACAIQQTLGTSGSFSTTGPHLFTVNIDPSSGAAGDRFQMRILGSRGSSHGNQTCNIVVNDVDTFMDGPWVVAGGYPSEYYDAHSPMMNPGVM